MNDKSLVSLRYQKTKNGGKSLFLDYRVGGKRIREFLHMYISPDADPLTKARNKKTMEAAKVLQSKRILELENGKAGMIPKSLQDVCMKDFFESVIARKRGMSKSYQDALQRTMHYWLKYAGERSKVRNITESMILGFIDFLQEQEEGHYAAGIKVQREKLYQGSCRAPTPEDMVKQVIRLVKEGKSQREAARITGLARSTVGTIISRNQRKKEIRYLSDQTVRQYFDRLGVFLKRAVKEGILMRNPMDLIESTEKPRTPNGERAFLTIDELKRLVESPCKYDIAKKMFMFACFTGLRFSDVRRVTWRMIDSGDIGIMQKKTGNIVHVPLTGNAEAWLPERPEDASPDTAVFSCYPPLGTIDKFIQRWADDAGIHKKITFHVSRHTFATLLITSGADLYVVSKLLGHQSVATTAIYAKVVDKRREEAVNAIPKLEI